VSGAPARPGSAPNVPLWSRQVPEKYDALMRNLELAGKIVGTAYLLLAAWKVATVLNPPLRVKQDLVIAAVRRRLAPPPRPDSLPPLTNADRAAIYDFTR
jgi:hypothetical protein